METTEHIELDADVIALIKAGKKVQAIKLMRERERFLEMAEAMSRIENYISRNPGLASTETSSETETGKSSPVNGMVYLVGFAILGVILYIAGS